MGGHAVLKELATIAPVLAVSGNTDDRSDPALPRERSIAAGRFTLHVSHGDELGRPTPEGLAGAYMAEIIVYGHTHRPLVSWVGRQLIVNPGSAGHRRFDLQPSVALLTVPDAGDPSVELIHLRA